MRTKLFFFALLLVPLIGTAQDSLSTDGKTSAVIDRFRAITGPDANYADSMALLRRKLDREIVRNDELSDSIDDLHAQLLLSEKKLLVRQYGAGKTPAYDRLQYADFRENLFLQQYFAAMRGVQVFFPFNEVNADYSLYTELPVLAGRCRSIPGTRLVITASTDSYGDETSNAKLAKERAEGVKAYLVSTCGVDASRIEIVLPGTEQRIPEPELDFLNRRAIVRLQ